MKLLMTSRNRTYTGSFDIAFRNFENALYDHRDVKNGNTLTWKRLSFEKHSLKCLYVARAQNWTSALKENTTRRHERI